MASSIINYPCQSGLESNNNTKSFVRDLPGYRRSLILEWCGCDSSIPLLQSVKVSVFHRIVKVGYLVITVLGLLDKMFSRKIHTSLNAQNSIPCFFNFHTQDLNVRKVEMLVRLWFYCMCLLDYQYLCTYLWRRKVMLPLTSLLIFWSFFKNMLPTLILVCLWMILNQVYRCDSSFSVLVFPLFYFLFHLLDFCFSHSSADFLFFDKVCIIFLSLLENLTAPWIRGVMINQKMEIP